MSEKILFQRLLINELHRKIELTLILETLKQKLQEQSRGLRNN